MINDNSKNVFEKIGLPKNPVMLAPLAGVSDYPFRIVCEQLGADLTYVEMLSATALCYKSERKLLICSTDIAMNRMLVSRSLLNQLKKWDVRLP